MWATQCAGQSRQCSQGHKRTSAPTNMTIEISRVSNAPISGGKGGGGRDYPRASMYNMPTVPITQTTSNSEKKAQVCTKGPLPVLHRDTKQYKHISADTWAVYPIRNVRRLAKEHDAQARASGAWGKMEKNVRGKGRSNDGELPPPGTQPSRVQAGLGAREVKAIGHIRALQPVLLVL